MNEQEEKIWKQRCKKKEEDRRKKLLKFIVEIKSEPSLTFSKCVDKLEDLLDCGCGHFNSCKLTDDSIDTEVPLENFNHE